MDTSLTVKNMWRQSWALMLREQSASGLSIDGNLPSIAYHVLLLIYATVAVGIRALIYKKYNTKFLYYV